MAASTDIINTIILILDFLNIFDYIPRTLFPFTVRSFNFKLGQNILPESLREAGNRMRHGISIHRAFFPSCLILHLPTFGFAAA